MTDHLRPEDLEELRRRLLDERAAIMSRAGVPPPDESPDPSDLQDKASDEAWRRAALSLGARDRKRVSEIDAALRRMEDGTYGICEEMGEPIPLARLRAEPTTRHTVEALEILEEERARERTLGRDDEEPDPY